MKNRKIIIDRPELSDSQIAEYMDFNSMKNTSVNSDIQNFLFKSVWLYTGVIGIAIITGAVIFFAKMPEREASNLKKKSVIQPPFSDLATPCEEYSVKTNSDTTILTNSGSLLHIPAKAFSNLDGSPVKSEMVNIKYREFHSPYDFFVNGIPMQYDSAGNSYTFQSAGMLEILAFDDSIPLDLAEGREIAIDMVSYDSRDIYNLYYLDTLTGQWQYNGRDHVEEIVEISSQEKPLLVENECNEVFVEDIWKPVLRDEKKFAFTLDVNKNEFPELDRFDNIIFEVDESKCTFDPLYYSIQWNDVVLSKSNNAGDYSLVMSKPDTSVSLSVYPVVDKASYQEAMKTYKQAITESEEQKKEAVEDRAIRPENPEEYFEMFNNDMLFSTFTPQAFRRVNIPVLGVWNCDMPVILPKGKKFRPDFVDDNKNNISYTNLYIVEKDANVLYELSSMDDIALNTKKDNMLWLLTADNQIAIPECNINDVSKSNDHVFKMKEYDYVIGMEMIREEAGRPAQADTDIEASVYPNPVNDWLNINFSEPLPVMVQILDSKGSIFSVMTTEEISIKVNMSAYPQGSYIINLISQSYDYRKSYKIIKQ